MSKKYPKFNTASEVMQHLEENVLSSEERVYYLQYLRLRGACGYHHDGNKEKYQKK